MKISALVAQLGPQLAERHLESLEDGPEKTKQRELIAVTLEAVSDALQAQEHEADTISRAKFLADMAVDLIAGQGFDITHDQARAAVDTAKVVLDRALEVSGRK